MIRKYTKIDSSKILHIINDAATKYKGIIPDDCWHEPYMSEQELIDEFNDSGINKSGARFDYKKALWINHLHIKDFSAEKVLALSEKAATQLGEKYSSEINLLLAFNKFAAS